MQQTSAQAPPNVPGSAVQGQLPKGNKGPVHWIRNHLLELAMVTPLFLYILYFMFIPVAQSIYYSFVHAGTHNFTLDNYRTIINRSAFGDAFVNTIGMTLMGVTMEMVLGIGISLMLVRAFHGRGIFRTIVLLPLGVPTIVAGAAMLYFVGFNGYINKILYDLGFIDIPIYWTESGLRGMFSIAIADVWKSLPLVVLILVAGLEGIPEDVYEAAGLDGANGWHKFIDHTIPLLMPSITMALILRAIDAFRIFDIAMVLAGQASLPVMSSFVYFDYRAGNTNTAAAAAVILLLMIIVFVLAYFFFVERRSEVER